MGHGARAHGLPWFCPLGDCRKDTDPPTDGLTLYEPRLRMEPCGSRCSLNREAYRVEDETFLSIDLPEHYRSSVFKKKLVVFSNNLNQPCINSSAPSPEKMTTESVSLLMYFATKYMPTDALRIERGFISKQSAKRSSSSERTLSLFVAD